MTQKLSGNRISLIRTPPFLRILLIYLVRNKFNLIKALHKSNSVYSLWRGIKGKVSQMTSITSNNSPFERDLIGAKYEYYLLRKKYSYLHDRIFLGKPLQYIFHSEYFNDLLIHVRQPVLIPRWETAEWTKKACEFMTKQPQVQRVDGKKIKVLDFCCGSGCIGLFIGSKFPLCEIIGVDISAEAVKLSRFNKNKLNIQNAIFHQVDIFNCEPITIEHVLKGPFDYAFSNPPYIPKYKKFSIDKSVTRWEDENALFSASNGLAHHFKIIQISSKCVERFLFMEVEGHHQVEKIAKFANQYGFMLKDHWKDSRDITRCIVLERTDHQSR